MFCYVFEILLTKCELTNMSNDISTNTSRPKDGNGKDDASYGGYHLSYEVKKLM